MFLTAWKCRDEEIFLKERPTVWGEIKGGVSVAEAVGS
jgi:hypothetical protein